VGADAALVLMGDLPAVTTFDLGVLVRELEETDVVIAPDERGRQTNALGVRLENRSPTAFGKLDSLRTHCEAAERRGLGLRRIASPTLAFDVDVPEDYVRLRERQRARGGLSTCLYRNRGSFVSDT
jgi:2-phospho-L-lactate guanylyltransferase (CobY/MobA/RfbA family)